jgi:uncharacterized delta-60 repeat protein
MDSVTLRLATLTALLFSFSFCAPRAGAAAPPVIELNATAFAASENAGSLTVRVVRRGNLARVSSVQFATANGSAVADSEFRATNGTLRFARGEAVLSFTVPLIDNFVLNPGQLFELALFAPSNAVLGAQSNATVTLTDDEYPVALDPGFNTGSGADNDIFSLALAPDGRIVLGGQFTSFNNVSGLANVAVLRPDGSVDPAFTRPDGAPNSSVYAVAVQTNGDLVIGGDFTSVGPAPRQFIARLRADGSLDTNFGVAGFNNAVRAISIQPDGRILAAGRFTGVLGQPRSYVARLNADGSLDATFDPGTNVNSYIRSLALQPDGRVLIGGEFTSINGFGRSGVARLTAQGALDLSFSPGAGADREVRSVAVQADGHILIGGDFENYNGAVRSSVARLFADGTVDPGFDQGPSTDDFVRVVAPGPGGKVWVGGRFATAGGAARANLALLGTDGRADAYAPGVFDAEVFAIATQPDNKTVVAGDFHSVSGVPLGRIARLRFSKDPPRPPQIQFTQPGTTAEESSGAAVVTVTRSGDWTMPARASFRTRNGTARAGVDYTATAGTLRFEPNETAKLIVVPLRNDSRTEVDKTFSVTLTKPVAPTTLGNSATNLVTIHDDDHGFEFTQNVFATSEPAGMATIAVRRGGTGADTVSVGFRAISGTAQAGRDFFPTNGTLVFRAGETQRTFIVRIQNDGLSEGLETVSLLLTNPSARASLGPRQTATLAIQDHDSVIQFSYAQDGAEPGTACAALLVRTGLMQLPATVRFRTSGGTATEGADFEAANTIVDFAPGQQYAGAAVTVLNDGLVESEETLFLHLSNPTGGAALGTASNMVTFITDNDAGLGFVNTNVMVSESSASVTLTVQRLDDGLAPLTVEYFTSNGTATAGINYVARNGVVSLTNYGGSNTFSIPLLDECGLTNERSFTVRLRNPSVPGVVGADGVAVVTVQGNEPAGRREVGFEPFGNPWDVWSFEPLAVLPDGKILAHVAAWSRGTLEGAWGLVRLMTEGLLDPTFPTVRLDDGWNHIYRIGVQRDGRMLVGVAWDGIELSSWTGMYRILPTGKVDAQFQPPEDFFGWPIPRSIDAGSFIEQLDGRILIGRETYHTYHSSAGFCHHAGIDRLMSDGTRDTSFDAGTGAVFNEYGSGVRTIALQPDGRILVAGLFTNFNGVPRHGLVRLETNGPVDLSFDPGSGADVGTIALQRDGRILITGSFADYNGIPRPGLARLLSNGAIDSSFDPGPIEPGGVAAMALQPNGRIVIGGGFTNVQGFARAGLARLNPDGSLDQTFDPAPDRYVVNSLLLQPDGRILVNGRTRVAGDPIPRLDFLTRLPGGDIRLRVASRPGQNYSLEASTNLVNWTAVQTNTAADCALEFLDPAAGGTRFYRAVELAP